MTTQHHTVTAVLAMIQNLEEIGGPEGADYVAALDTIIADAQRRRQTYLSIHPPIGSYGIYTPADADSPRDMPCIVTSTGVEAIAPEHRDYFHREGISPACDWPNVESFRPLPGVDLPALRRKIESGTMLNRVERIILEDRSTFNTKANYEACALIDLHMQKFGEF